MIRSTQSRADLSSAFGDFRDSERGSLHGAARQKQAEEQVRNAEARVREADARWLLPRRPSVS